MAVVLVAVTVTFETVTSRTNRPGFPEYTRMAPCSMSLSQLAPLTVPSVMATRSTDRVKNGFPSLATYKPAELVFATEK